MGLSNRVVGQIHLQASFDRLHHRQKQGKCGKNQRNDGDPKGKPLRPVAAVMPPLRDGSRGRLIVGLLQHAQSIAPEPEPFDLTLTARHPPTPAQTFIHKASASVYVTLAELSQPHSFLAFGPLWLAVFVLWEKEGDRFDCLLGQSCWEQCSCLSVSITGSLVPGHS